MFELNLNIARKAVTEIFESDGEKIDSCDSAKNVLIDMAYFMGKRDLGNNKKFLNLKEYVKKKNWKDAAESIGKSDWCTQIKDRF